MIFFPSADAIIASFYRKQTPFSFFSDLAPGVSKKTLQQSANKVCLVWESQLMQINGVSHPVASAIASVYPSPAKLYEVRRFAVWGVCALKLF